MPTTTTTTEPDPTTTTTTTVPEPDLEEGFVEHIRDVWARAARTLGGEVPDLTDEEILDIGWAVCEHLAVDQSALKGKKSNESMVAYAEVAAIITEWLGLPYDSALLDAGYESRFDSALVSAFANTGNNSLRGGRYQLPGALCPEFDPATDKWIGKMFASPWSGAASPR
jgi:hypothetical protein